MRTSIHITSMNVADDESGTSYSIPVVVVTNDDYDEDQEQIAEEKLPITENLIFMRYTIEEGAGGPDDSLELAKTGYVFYYPELDDCKIIECESGKSATMRDELEQFE